MTGTDARTGTGTGQRTGTGAGPRAPAAAGRLSRAQRDAVLRWKLGHHAFHLLLAAMNTRLDGARRVLADEDWPAVRAALLDLATMYDGATAVMRYAADFPRTDYERLVRVSMAPPFAAAGFSGVYNTEHAAMLTGLRALRGLWGERCARAPAPVQEAWARLREAQRANQRNHMFVCRRFVDDGVSLLAEFFAARGAAG